MEIYENIEIIDLCLYLKKEKILVIGDMHIGLEEALNKQGILIPRQGVDDVIKRLKKIISKIKVKEIILIGDVKHEFGVISDQEWRDTLKVLDFLLSKSKVILIKKNYLIVIPSFNLLNEGSDVTKENILSPYIKNIKKFRIFISDDKEAKDF